MHVYETSTWETGSLCDWSMKNASPHWLMERVMTRWDWLTWAKHRLRPTFACLVHKLLYYRCRPGILDEGTFEAGQTLNTSINRLRNENSPTTCNVMKYSAGLRTSFGDVDVLLTWPVLMGPVPNKGWGCLYNRRVVQNRSYNNFVLEHIGADSMRAKGRLPHGSLIIPAEIYFYLHAGLYSRY